MQVRVIIVDNHQVVRLGLKVLLDTDPEIDLIGMAANGLEAVQKVRELKPDVVLMDLKMPVMDGFEATAIIKKEMPGVRVIILSFLAEESVISRAREAGADVYIVKGASGETVRRTIKEAA